jgi:hypothetical protein
MRIIHRKYGRDGQSTYATGATHVIKIGFDARKPGADRPVPGKLAGFLLCRDALDSSNNLIVDEEAMLALGKDYTAANITKAKQQGLKAEQGLLPNVLNFVIAHDAVKTPGGWSYQGTFGEAYDCWSKSGLFCSGNGDKAMRRQNDGTRKEIICNPAGKDGVAADDFCKESVGKACKAHSRLVLCLFADGADGKPQPLSKALGWQARFRFDTSSEYNPIRIIQELDQAAERLNGRIAGITGTLTFQLQRKRYEGGVSIVGQIMFQLSESDIRRREEQIWNRNLEYKRVEVGLLSHTPATQPEQAETKADESPFDNAPEWNQEEPGAIQDGEIIEPPHEEPFADPAEAVAATEEAFDGQQVNPGQPENPETPAPNGPAKPGQIDEIKSLCDEKDIIASEVTERFGAASLQTLTYAQAERAISGLMRSAKRGTAKQ